MENASRALLMATGILVAVSIISVGVALVNSFAGTSRDIIDTLEVHKITEFNNQFYKFYGDGVRITAHDVITIANTAKQSNAENEIEDQSKYSDNSDYVQVQVNKDANFEKKSSVEYAEFIKNNMLVSVPTGAPEIKEFECTSIITSSVTGKVIFVKIEEKK